MIDPTHKLPVSRQAKVLNIARSTAYDRPTPVASEDLALMAAMDRLHLDYPFAGARMLRDMLVRPGFEGIGRRHVGRLMKCTGIEALYRKPNTSKRHSQHRIDPYLLRGLAIERPNQVWAMDITYLPMKRGFLYLVAVRDWATRKVLAHRLSNTMHTDFCTDALNAALTQYGKPEIMNTDQGSQFTSMEVTQTLKDHDIQISMDGKGFWRDNVFIERFWRTIKYEEVYMRAYETTSQARGHLNRYIDFYNQQRPHPSLGGLSPDNIYFVNPTAALAA